MRLLSINVAQPVEVKFGGQLVPTSIFKKSVTAPVRVAILNLEGDRQADLTVHGGPDKAIYAYSWKNIEYWRKFLRRDDLGPGAFGENLTVDDLTDEEIAIGDELEIGTARFVVTQPRIPCFKLGIALNAPDFPKIFHYAGRNGFYLRVLQEGRVEAGDAIRQIQVASGERITIAEFVRITNAPNPAPEQLERLLRIESLPSSKKARLKSKFEGKSGDK